MSNGTRVFWVFFGAMTAGLIGLWGLGEGPVEQFGRPASLALAILMALAPWRDTTTHSAKEE